MSDFVEGMIVGSLVVAVLMTLATWQWNRLFHELQRKVKSRERLIESFEHRLGKLQKACDDMQEECDREIEAAQQAIGQVGDAEVWERKFWETHKVVEKALKERDEWKDLFYAQGAAHLEGQAILEQGILRLRNEQKQLVQLLNQHLPDGKKFDPKKLPALDAEPLGEARRYLDKIRKLSQEAHAWSAKGQEHSDDRLRVERDEVRAS